MIASRVARRIIACGLTAIALSAPAQANVCHVKYLPNRAGPEWLVASQDVARLVQHAPNDRACAVIELQVDGPLARLTLTTPDGRRATRDIGQPFEVVPTAQALLVTLDEPPTDPNLPRTLDVPPKVLVDAPDHPQQEGGATWASRVLLGGAAGARIGSGLITPVIGLSGLISQRKWEFGVFGQWEPSYESLKKVPAPDWTGIGFTVGVMLGRREPLSARLEAIGGVSLAGALLHQESHHIHPEQHVIAAQPRLGGYTGAVWTARERRWRGRLQLGADVSPQTPAAAGPGIPTLPSWGTALTLGLETEVP
jgi:hypothetical protein